MLELLFAILVFRRIWRYKKDEETRTGKKSSVLSPKLKRWLALIVSGSFLSLIAKTLDFSGVGKYGDAAENCREAVGYRDIVDRCFENMPPVFLSQLSVTSMSWYISSWILFIHKYADFTLIVPPVMLKLAPNVTKRRKRIIAAEVIAFIGVAAYLTSNITLSFLNDFYGSPVENMGPLSFTVMSV